RWRIAARLAPTASVRAAATPPCWVSSETSRWAGSSCGFPAVEAAWIAAAIASCDLVVNLSIKTSGVVQGSDEFNTAGLSLFHSILVPRPRVRRHGQPSSAGFARAETVHLLPRPKGSAPFYAE